MARLLPGDPAPELRVSRWFIGETEDGSPSPHRPATDPDAEAIDPSVDVIRFDQPGLVVLWNAGCSACLPAIRDLAEVGARHGVLCYGVAVMVHDVETTGQIALSTPSKARLALEERPHQPAAFSRGWVTRRWLEPSGQNVIPTAFAINRNGVIARIGQPDELEAVLPDLLSSEWDVEAERRRWASVVSDDTVHAIRTRMDAMDLLVEGEAPSALATIENAERRWPSVMQERELSYTKLEVLIANPDREDEAVAHYAWTAETFGDDRHFQLRLASWVLARMASEPALAIVIEHLSALESVAAKGDENDNEQDKLTPPSECRPLDDRAQVDLLTLAWLHLTLADALVRVGRSAEAAPRIERAEALSENEGLPDRYRSWFASEIERLRQTANTGR